MKFQILYCIGSLLLLTNCSPLPQKKLQQATLKRINYEVSNDSLIITFGNPLYCPLTISANTDDAELQEKINLNFPVAVWPNSDTLIWYKTNKTKEEIDISFSAKLGNSKDSVNKKKISLPFTKGSVYKIIQGYIGSYSHSSEFSKYAIDFDMKEGDTVCAVADGYVVGVIEGYTNGGTSKKWRDYANYITVFHPEMNLYTQYVHLTHNGSFVEVDDYVKTSQPIGLSGQTGYTDIEHLHFNVLRATKNGMLSTPIEFIEGYKGVDFKKGDWVEK